MNLKLTTRYLTLVCLHILCYRPQISLLISTYLTPFTIFERTDRTRATHVPIGEDQKQHLELARDIAMTFTHTFKPLFPNPKPILSTFQNSTREYF